MAGELKHASVGSDLTQAEWESVDGHTADGQTLGDLLRFNGTNWVRIPLTDLFGSSVLASRPAAGIAGRHWLVTDDDSGTLYRDTGAAWVQVASGVTQAAAPTGAAGGDLAGTYPNPTVGAIHAGSAHHTEDHDHDGSPTQKLAQANTHQSPDTDAATTSLHHTLGTGATQAAAGNHLHSNLAPGGFYVYKSGSTYYAVNLETGALITSGAVAETVINTAIQALNQNNNGADQSGGTGILGPYRIVLTGPVEIGVDTTYPGDGVCLQGSSFRRGTLLVQGASLSTDTIDTESIAKGLITVGSATNHPKGVVIRDISMYSPGSGTYANGNGIRLKGNNCRVERVFINKMPQHGIYHYGTDASNHKSFVNEFDAVFISECGGHGIQTCGATGPGKAWASDTLFHDVLVAGDPALTGVNGFNIRTGSNWLDQCHAWFNSGYGFRIETESNMLINCISESNEDTGVYITGSKCGVFGGYFYRNDQDANTTAADIRNAANGGSIIGTKHQFLTTGIERVIWIDGTDTIVMGVIIADNAATEVGILINNADDSIIMGNMIGSGPTHSIAFAGTANNNLVMSNHCAGSINEGYAGGTGTGNRIFDNVATSVTIVGATTRFRDGNGNGRRVNKTANYTAMCADRYVTCSGAGAAFTITLPLAADAGDGHVVTVKRVNSTNPVTVDGNGAETIDGVATYALDTAYKSVTLLCDGAAWNVIGATG